MRVILVPVADRPECTRALKTAFHLGQRLGASLTGCHIRPHSDSKVAIPAELVNFDSALSVGDKSKKSRKASDAAELMFAKVALHYGYPLIKRPGAKPGAVWLEKVGSPDKVLSIMAPLSDLVVVSRPKTKGGKLARLFLDAALLNSARPALVLPQSGKVSIGQNISIAWNQSLEAMQAVVAAMPLLRLASNVNIITCGKEGGAHPTSRQLANYLRYWGVSANRVTASGDDDAQALLKSYLETNSDLLVMGAYSRSRLRQRMFGGVTDYMLTRASIPVFMLHT